MVNTIVADAFAWLLFLGVTAVGVTLTVLGTMRAYRSMHTHGRNEVESNIAAVACAVILFLGGWLLLGLYWLAAWILREVRRDHTGQLHEG